MLMTKEVLKYENIRISKYTIICHKMYNICYMFYKPIYICQKSKYQILKCTFKLNIIIIIIKKITGIYINCKINNLIK